MAKSMIHPAQRLTVEEAGVATIERAVQLQGAAVALLTQQGSKLDDWDLMLSSWAENRPWQFLPEDLKEKYGKWHAWTAATMTFNGDPLTRDRLVSLLAGLYGSTAKAEERIQAFEKEIEQPFIARPGRPAKPKNPYPDKGLVMQKARHGTNVGYLMGRLLRKDPNIADKIGKGKDYASINAAAQALGLIAARNRYELNADSNLSNAATRIVDVLGAEKAATLLAHLESKLEGAGR